MIVTTADEVRAAIKAGLDVLRPYQRRGLGIDPDQARAWLAEDLVRRIVGVSRDHGDTPSRSAERRET